jgi:uncharacterized membrane protein
MHDRVLRAGVALVALVGAGVAAYLTYVHYRPAALICTAGGGCETVQESSYAELVGIPVALLGLCAYVLVLALVAWDSDAARTVVATIALAAVGFAIYLVLLQALVIDAWCVWCLVNDVAVVPLLAVFAVLRVLREPEGPATS